MSNCTHEPGVCCKKDEFIKSATYEECIYHAFYNKDGNKYSHQRRIPDQVLEDYRKELLPLEREVRNCRNFDDIYKLFESHQIRGIGDLAIYDVSLRVSQNYNIYPDKVYLHAGTRRGARNAGLITNRDRRNKLTPDEIARVLPWLRDVEPYLIEDFLCVYEDDISEQNLKIFLRESHGKDNCCGNAHRSCI